MAYERLDESVLDYDPCKYGRSKLNFRGPSKNLDVPYVAIIGGTETYGKYIEKPFSDSLENVLNMPVVNLGCMNAGVDVFLNDPEVLDICSRAQVTVIQITGAQNISNRYYTVHPRRNDRFLRTSELLLKTFDGVDFSEVHFTRHLLAVLAASSAEKFDLVQRELKSAWLSRMRALIAKIEGKIVLLWMSDRAPPDAQDAMGLGHQPLFVDKTMQDALRSEVAEIVEIVATPDEISAGYERMMFTALQEPTVQEMLGPVVHEAVARCLGDVITPMLKRNRPTY